MTALYRQLCDRILRRIECGELKVGDRLPPEADVATEMGVSRSTVRLAFADLESSGVLERRKRTGTRIVSDKPRQRFDMATDGLHELLSLGRDTELAISRITHTDDPPVPGHCKLDCDRWLEVLGTRTLPGDDSPFSVNRVYVPDYFADIETTLREGSVRSVYQCIESSHGVSARRVTQSVSAIRFPPEDARFMSLSADAPVLRIEALLFVEQERLMEVSVAVFDPARFQVQTDVIVG